MIEGLGVFSHFNMYLIFYKAFDIHVLKSNTYFFATYIYLYLLFREKDKIAKIHQKISV